MPKTTLGCFHFLFMIDSSLRLSCLHFVARFVVIAFSFGSFSHRCGSDKPWNEHAYCFPAASDWLSNPWHRQCLSLAWHVIGSSIGTRRAGYGARQSSSARQDWQCVRGLSCTRCPDKVGSTVRVLRPFQPAWVGQLSFVRSDAALPFSVSSVVSWHKMLPNAWPLYFPLSSTSSRRRRSPLLGRGWGRFLFPSISSRRRRSPLLGRGRGRFPLGRGRSPFSFSLSSLFVLVLCSCS